MHVEGWQQTIWMNKLNTTSTEHRFWRLQIFEYVIRNCQCINAYVSFSQEMCNSQRLVVIERVWGWTKAQATPSMPKAPRAPMDLKSEMGQLQFGVGGRESRGGG